MASQDYAAAFNTTIDKHILVNFEGWQSIIPDIFHVDSTKKRFVTIQGWTGYGLPLSRLPGEPIVQGSISENYNIRLTVGSCGLGDAIPIEDVDDDPTGMLTQGAARIGGGMSESFMDYVEQDICNYLINGFSATAGMADGKSLFSLTHPQARNNPGTSYTNRPTTGVDISVSSVQSMITRIRTQKAPNGRPMNNRPRVLWYNPILDFQVKQILKQQLEPYTFDHNDNIISKQYGNIKPVETPFLQESGADADAFGMIGEQHFLYFYWRNRPRTHNDFDATTKTYLTMLDMRYTRGAGDWRGTDASPGA